MGIGQFRKLREQLRDGRTKVLLWTTLVALIFGAIQFGEPLEYFLRMTRDRLREHPPSGDIVLVAIDDKSVASREGMLLARSDHAAMIDALASGGARSITYASDLPPARSEADRASLAAAIRRHPQVVRLSARFDLGSRDEASRSIIADLTLQPLPEQVNTNFRYNFTGTAWRLPFALDMHGTKVPSVGARLAGVTGDTAVTYRVDYAVEVTAITHISAIDVLKRRGIAAVRGRDVVIANTAPTISDNFFVPGHGHLPTVYIHLAGAETLKRGQPIEIGWFVPFLCALAIAILGTSRRNGKAGGAIAASGILLLLFGPLPFEEASIFMDVTPALFLICSVSLFIGSGRLWRTYRQRANVNGVSGLPNLNALRQEADAGGKALIVTRVHNYAEICAALAVDQEGALALEIAKRLGIGVPIPKLFHGDEGIFAWFVPLERAGQIEEHLEALQALFRTPVVVGAAKFDPVVTFGIETTQGRSLASRLGSALVAADQAAAAGRAWGRYDPERLKEAPWRLSILSQLDAAVESGDLWVAYQPKINLATRSLIGAEALVRWTHPDKGPIPPLEFIPLAEQNGRIAGLTHFVLERAVRAAAFINKSGLEFGMSVNLSAKLLHEHGLDETVIKILDRYQLPPERLTLEVTETAALATDGDDLDSLHRLRRIGVLVSIDDYGTGLSTLEYMRRIPATEIKIDRSFIQSIYKNHSDKLMVHSTIQLAHSLGQKVVGEGVEDAQTLEALAYMGCDEAQGYFIGRPVPFRLLVRQLRQSSGVQAA
ncbi:EAL domain-containing protein [Sphingosinicella sp. BN140058]|uniref:EAL domain-containing protein n=1 Tax=Sphingosinicella sp. BN140058 TaxID=1892855 RepID=UPI001010C345|nr:EAL domain-containing protein [Sphingosinicella sp. BN140058]QAY78306.1 EAL domain-containing protein [Sphingosinicella sp. BN140058]